MEERVEERVEQGSCTHRVHADFVSHRIVVVGERLDEGVVAAHGRLDVLHRHARHEARVSVNLAEVGVGAGELKGKGTSQGGSTRA